MNSINKDLLLEAYAAFNRRDIDAVLNLMSEDVEWPNAMEGTYVHGKEAVRAYWTHQWSLADPRVDPVAITDSSENESIVRVNQIVRTLDGMIISEGLLDHVYQIGGGLITRMRIQDDAGKNRFAQSDG